MRSRRRFVPIAAVLGVAMVMLPAEASSVEPIPVEALNVPAGIYTEEKHYWQPSQQTVMAGSVVTFRNPGTIVPHGVHWVGGPNTPACSSGVPVGTAPAQSGVSWTGTCTFTEPGAYTFYCTVHGPEMTGTITVKNVGEPVAATGAATLVSESGATLNGTVDPEGNKTSYFFKYGRTTSYEDGSTPLGELPAVKAGEAVSAPVTGLALGTTYHFQLVAENSAGVAHGADQTFTTPGPPSATTGAATALSETKAMLKGTVNPDGRSTKYFFEWGTSTSYGNATTEVPAGEDHSGHLASALLAELAPGTVYYFRLVAKNTSAETAFGAEEMFKTVSAPSSTTTTATTSSAPPPPPTARTLVEPPPGPPIVGSPSLRATQHGSSVRGSLDISQSGAGGRLEVDLLAKSASLAKTRHSGSVRVGRLVRASLSAGRESFSVALTASGKRGLTRHRRLAVTVKITLTPIRGETTSITRSVTLRL